MHTETDPFSSVDTRHHPPMTMADTSFQKAELRSFTFEQIKVMLNKERKVYRYDLFLKHAEQNLEPSCLQPQPQMCSPLNSAWREKICQWSYNVVDHFDLPRELVGISLDLFDRFLATKGNQCSGNTVLLTSLTTLHIAIKLHSETRIKVTTLASLSRGQFDVAHIEAMEMHILSALRWKLHPPTMFAFVSYFLAIFPNEVHPSVRRDVFELAIYLAELSVCDSFFVRANASDIAFAAILNAMDDMPFSRMPAGTRETFLRDLAVHFHFSCQSRTIYILQERLRAMLEPEMQEDVEEPVMATGPGTASTIVSYSDAPSPMQVDAPSCATGSVSNRSRSSSFDSKGGNSCAYSPSTTVVGAPSHQNGNTQRRRYMLPASPMSTSRNRMASSPIVAVMQ